METLISRDIKKILVIKLRHIGDVLLTVPVFRALRENFPDAHISALVNSGTEEVLSGNPLINEIIIFDRNMKRMNPIQKYIKELSFLKKIRKKSFDMVVDLTGGDRAAIISFASGARYRIAYCPGRDGFSGKKYLYNHLAKKLGNQHMVLRNLDVVKQFGIDTKNTDLDFFIPEDARMFVKKIFEENNIINPLSLPFDSPLTKGGHRGVKGGQRGVKVVHIHPTSRWLFKCWEDEYMAEVIRWLLDKGITVIVTSSHDMREMEKAKNILSLVDELTPPLVRKGMGGVINLCGKTTIKQLSAISEASDLFIGVDSAPMHIAAAVGTPVIAIFGAGVQSWKPWGKDHVVVFKEAVSRNGMDRKERIKRNISQITPKDVIEKIKGFLFNNR
jgi:heptosyltransferase-3